MNQARLHIALLICLPALCLGQSLAPTVISSTGGYNSIPGFSLSYTVGEPFITTLQTPDNILTQGFQQPQKANALNVALNITDESCINSNDGSASLAITGGTTPYTIVWSSDTARNNPNIDSLMPGIYTVTVTDHSGLTTNATFNIAANDNKCKLKEYHGITPNGDGHNDTWIIDNIDMFPDNKVSIYNRWGDEVWAKSGYDNTTRVWRGDNSKGDPLPDGTYFYVVKYGGNTDNGWVQLTR